MYYGNNAGVSPGVQALVEQIRSGRGGSAGQRAEMMGVGQVGSLNQLGLSGPAPAVVGAGGPARGFAYQQVGRPGSTPEEQAAMREALRAQGGAMPKPAIAPTRGMPGRGAVMPGSPGPVRPQIDQLPPSLRARVIAAQGGRLVR